MASSRRPRTQAMVQPSNRVIRFKRHMLSCTKVNYLSSGLSIGLPKYGDSAALSSSALPVATLGNL